MSIPAAIQVAAPQSGKAGPDRERRDELESTQAVEAEPVTLAHGPTKSHDGQTAHPGSNLYPTGPGGAMQDIGGDISSPELTSHLKTTADGAADVPPPVPKP